MKSEIKILRYTLKLDATNESKVLLYFDNKKWKKLSKEGLYCLKNTTIYFLISKTDVEIHIDIWAEGSFGVIFPYKGRLYSILGQIVFDSVVSQFTSYLDQNSVQFSEGFTSVQGRSQARLLFVVVVVPFFIAFLWLILVYKS